MPMLNTVTRIISKPMPRMISPRGHAFFDYFTVGWFFASAARFWKFNKRAAVAALVCGGTGLAVDLLTDYPGGVKKVIHFGTRQEIDLGLAAMAATMPEFLAFKDEPEKKFFLAEGALITATSQLTEFPEKPQRAEKIARGRVA